MTQNVSVTSGSASHLERKNRRVAAYTAAAVFAMLGLAFASVPLYRLFCQVTGFGGTPSFVSAESVSSTVLEREMTVEFQTSVSPKVPLEFSPLQRNLTSKIGEVNTAYFVATNPTDKAVWTMASYHVAPDQMGYYFDKIECFCSVRQKFAPGESKELTVSYVINPEIAESTDLETLKTAILYYVFQPTEPDPNDPDELKKS